MIHVSMNFNDKKTPVALRLRALCVLCALVGLPGCILDPAIENSAAIRAEIPGPCILPGARGASEFSDEWPPSFNIGRTASEVEIKAWDTDVAPDGSGLPAGQGTAAAGISIYEEKCAACHGKDGTGATADRLVGREPRTGFPFGQSSSHLAQKSIGNYWPYATTLFDYTNRSMPQIAPGSLTADEVYSLVAYLLHMNELISANEVIDSNSLPLVRMPARDRFVPDSRCGGPVIR